MDGGYSLILLDLTMQMGGMLGVHVRDVAIRENLCYTFLHCLLDLQGTFGGAKTQEKGSGCQANGSRRWIQV